MNGTLNSANETFRSGQAPSPPCSRAPRAALVAVKASFPPGFRSAWHCTDRAQLIYPSRGVMTISTRSGSWVVPPMRACWLPAAAGHAVETTTGLEMHSIYCDRLPGLMPESCGIVPVTPLLREMILALGEMPADIPGSTLGEKIDAWLAGQLAPQSPPLLLLPTPSSRPLQRLAEALQENPADRRTLKQWASALATTPRTLSRAFAREMQMPFTEFRRQVRLRASLVKLGQGQPVTTVALDLGFSSAANFIATFRRTTGQTPKAYFKGCHGR